LSANGTKRKIAFARLILAPDTKADVARQEIQRSLLERDSFAVSPMNFPVLLLREFTGESLERHPKSEALSYV
jgi:hypothetical protein